MASNIVMVKSRGATAPQKMARALGWFSIGLGIAELVAPKMVSRLCGIRISDALVRSYGVREIITGIGILRSRDARPWLWARVGGDLVDMGTLVRADPSGLTSANADIALLNVAAVTALDLHTACYFKPGAPMRMVDYSGRSGFPRPPEEMRGAARMERAEPVAAASAE